MSVIQPAPAGNEGLTLQITLNPDAVAAPALRAMQDSVETVAMALNALEAAGDEAPPQMPGAQMRLSFSGSDEAPPDRRARQVNWLLAKGFHDIAQGIRETLEEAYLYCVVARRGGGRTTIAEIQAWFDQTKMQANRMNFPDLLGSVSRFLQEPLQHSAELQTLNAVRNCLEHRGGVVGQQDVKDGPLILMLPRLRMEVVSDGVAKDVEIGMYVEKGGVIQARQDRLEKTFQLGERVTFTSAEFQEIAFACAYVVADIQKKLPKIAEVGA